MLALVVPVLVAGCGESAWREFTSPEGGFSVRLPGKPREITKTQDAGSGRITLHSHGVDARDGTYAVSYADLSPGTPINYDLMRKGLLQRVKGQLVSETDVARGEIAGRQFEVQTENPKGFAVVQVYRVGDRAYELLAVGPNVRASSEGAQKFFNSFQVTR